MQKIGKYFIFIGLCILSIPIIGGIYTQYQQKQMYKNYLANMEVLASSMEEMNITFEHDSNLNVEVASEISEGYSQEDKEIRKEEHTQEEQVGEIVIEKNEVLQERMVVQTPNGIGVMGLVSIPKIGIEVMLVEGVTDYALKYAVGHMPGTALPGEVGNTSIAGHRSYTFGEYFNRLNEVEQGDIIEITYGTKCYKYEVYESFLVEPSEVSVLEPQGDREVVTLITCHPIVAATHRLIVRGELIETVDLLN